VDLQAAPEVRRSFRLATTRRFIPGMLLWAGALTLLFGVLNYAFRADEAVSAWTVNLIFGPLFLLLSWLLRRPAVADSAVPWAWALCELLLVGMLINAFRVQPTPANLAYVAMAIIALGPLTSMWAPFIVCNAGALVVATIALLSTTGADAADSLLVCTAAVLVSTALLRQRVNYLDSQADAIIRIEHIAVSDNLTDLLNRNGLERAIPGLVATAQRRGERILVWFVDIRGLKTANDRFGHDFGDEVILAVSGALRVSVRGNDLIIRWGGDEFVVLGCGTDGCAEALEERMEADLRGYRAILDRWPGMVTAGFSAGDPDADVYSLITQADADMYQRRAGS
jgi:diguanylate cyclase (GGDEF)-like protein